VHNAATRMIEREPGVDETERRCRHDEEAHRRGCVAMAAQEGRPALPPVAPNCNTYS
jgi:hypothetical protein